MANPTQIEHVVVLMMENRSFDHLLGTLSNVNGIMSANGSPNPQFFNLANPADSTSKQYAVGTPGNFAVPSQDIGKGGFGGPGHSFAAATQQLDASATTESGVANPAPLNGFIANYIRELKSNGRSSPSDQEIIEPMTNFTAAQMPVMSALATEFCVCDQWYSEVPGPTEPNRLFVHAATSAGFVDNEWQAPISAQTIYQLLEQAGFDWAFFYVDLSDSDSFPALKVRTTRIFQMSAFAQQTSAGTLPAYSFICPQMNEGTDGSQPNSQHAPYDVRLGENLIADVYEAVRNGPLWESTLLIVTYDEHGGYFDHVSPPIGVNNPDGLTSPNAYVTALAQKNPKGKGYLTAANMDFDFTRLGMRVPTVLISPWIQKGTVDSTQYQHTSIFATLRDLFGVGTLTKRDAQANSFTAQLTKLSSARTDAPTTLTRPAMPAAASAAEMQKPLTKPQQELWPMLSHLDGHPDSGKVTQPPPTRAAAAEYIQERLAAHRMFHRLRRRKAFYEIYASGGKFAWRFHDDKGKVLAISTQTYASPAKAQADIERMRDLAPFARQTSPAAPQGNKSGKPSKGKALKGKTSIGKTKRAAKKSRKR
jgi:phospholipase C